MAFPYGIPMPRPDRPLSLSYAARANFPAGPTPPQETNMTDLAFLAAGLLFFALCRAYAILCNRL